MPTHRPRAHAVMSADAFDALFDVARRDRVAALAHVPEAMLVEDVSEPALDATLAGIEVLITSWGAPEFDAALLSRLPRLRAVFHAAGSVRHHVTDEFWQRGIRITTAAEANSVPVAEFTLAAILFAGKRVLPQLRSPLTEADWGTQLHQPSIGNLDRTVGVVGYSRIGRRVVDLLRPFDGLRVLVADPFADAAEIEAAGASLVPLDRMLPQVDVLSLHAPALPSTHNMIAAPQLAALRDGATLINTARGTLLDHDALLAEARTGRLDAILDVTEPEPLPDDSELYDLPNVAVTPHLAGSLGTETRRLTDTALDELEAYTAGHEPRHPVTPESLGLSA